jgi:hypothetical protein
MPSGPSRAYIRNNFCYMYPLVISSAHRFDAAGNHKTLPDFEDDLLIVKVRGACHKHADNAL